MRVLLDHCVPKRFRQLLPGHDVRTAYEMGWADRRCRLIDGAGETRVVT
jgi:hypothetical protein